ncbi:unnamed protein product, partial [Urochloa humidicola]
MAQLRNESLDYTWMETPAGTWEGDRQAAAWNEVEDIGGAALFLDVRASYAVASPEGGHGNKIFLPLFSEDGQQVAFYDMETKIYMSWQSLEDGPEQP